MQIPRIRRLGGKFRARVRDRASRWSIRDPEWMWGRRTTKRAYAFSVRHFVFLLVTTCSSSPLTNAAPAATTATPAPTASAIADRDGDGVPDECDYCPGQPGIDRADHPYGRGCPYIDQFVSTVDFAGPPIAFTSGLSYKHRSLEAVASGMKANAHVTFFLVGHVTSDEPNGDVLSLQRAETIRAELVALGVAPTAIQAFGAGTSGYPAREVTFDASHDRARQRMWSPTQHDVVYVPLPDLCAARN
jgi:hypothetical protein